MQTCICLICCKPLIPFYIGNRRKKINDTKKGRQASIDRHVKYVRVCIDCKNTETVYLLANAWPGYL